MTQRALNPQGPFREVAEVVNSILNGKINSYGSVTLTDNAASTTVAAPYCSGESVVSLMPTTANAAAEIGNGTMYVTPDNGEFVITHANNAQTDRTFGFVVLG